MEISALTELDAVNNIIGTIGESPINSLETLQNVDAINALRILREVSRQEQARGWSFNIIEEHLLTPDTYTKRIPWSENYLFLKGVNGEKLVRSGDFVKDLTNNQLTFNNTVTVQAVLMLPFEDLPEAMRSFIITKAAHKFQSRYFGDEALTQITQRDVQEAWQYLMEFEVDNNDYNLLNHTYVQELLSR